MTLAVVVKEGFTLLEGLRIIVLQPHQAFQIPQLPLKTLPCGLLSAEHGNCKSTYRDMGGLEPEELDFNQGQVEQVTSVKEYAGLADINGTTVVLQECLRWRTVNVKLDCLKDLALHLQDFLRVKELVAELDEVLHHRWVDLLKLTGYPERCDAQQLELAQSDVFFTQVPIDDVNSDEERFGAQFALDLKVDQPINQSFPVLGPDVGLTAHIAGARLILAFSKFQ